MNVLISTLHTATVMTKAEAASVAAANNLDAEFGETYKVEAFEHGFVVSLYDAEGFVGTF